MPNQLKDIFSDKMFDFGGKISFQNNKFHKQFLEALKIVENEGQQVVVTGISSLTAYAKDGELEYPFIEQLDFDEFIIAPSTDDVSFAVSTEVGESTILFKRYYTTKEVILETDKNGIVCFKMIFQRNTLDETFQFSYKIQSQLAKTVKEVVESFSRALALLDKLFLNKEIQNEDDESTLICNTRKVFSGSKMFFERLYSIEKELHIFFNPADENDVESRESDVNELYLLLIEKKVIRLNAKLNATEATGITMVPGSKKPKIGSQIDITFLSKSEYIIYGQTFSIYTANLLSNAAIKEIREEENGGAMLLYDDTDSKPMYISYTAFKTIDEAQQEMKVIMDHKAKYTDALTSSEYINKSLQAVQG